MNTSGSPTPAIGQAHTWATLLLAPVLLFQGHRVKKHIIRLPEPLGEREGETGQGPQLRLLILGDSSVAGVGVKHQDDALSGHLLRILSQHFKVTWRLQAISGNNTLNTLEQLRKLPQQKFDVAIISVGVNDVTAGLSSTAWMSNLQTLIDHLTASYPTQHILISNLPPMHRFPALPQPLRWYLGNRAKHYNQVIQILARKNPACHIITLKDAGHQGDLAEDGFHPSKKIYSLWAGAISETILHQHKNELANVNPTTQRQNHT